MKNLIYIIVCAIGILGCSNQKAPDIQFVFVKIPEQIMPLERGAKYEDPLDAILKKEKVGEVAGGGTQMSDQDKDGKRTIEWIGIDVDLTDFKRGLPILKSGLIKLGVPEGTILEYTRDGKDHSEKVKER